MENKKALSLLGLAVRAGKVESGEFSTEQAIKRKKASLVIVAVDASENTRKQFRDKCAYFKIPLYFWETKETLGSSMGKGFRASLAIVDKKFARGMIEQLDQTEEPEHIEQQQGRGNPGIPGHREQKVRKGNDTASGAGRRTERYRAGKGNSGVPGHGGQKKPARGLGGHIGQIRTTE